MHEDVLNLEGVGYKLMDFWIVEVDMLKNFDIRYYKDRPCLDIFIMLKCLNIAKLESRNVMVKMVLHQDVMKTSGFVEVFRSRFFKLV